MPKCKHDNLVVTEYYSMLNADMLFEDGQLVGNDDNTYQIFGDHQTIENFLDVECHDCGLSKRYSKNRPPKWLVEKFRNTEYRGLQDHE